MDEKRNEEDLSAWNLSQNLIQQIGALIYSASQSFKSGKLNNSYWDSREIRLLIWHDLNDKEKKDLYSLEQNLGKMCSGKTITQESDKNYFLTKYREMIIELLGKYGYLISKKKDSKRIM